MMSSRLSTILPLRKPRPDSAHFLDVLMGRKKAVPPLVEYLVDDVVMKPIVENLLGRTWVPAGATGTSHEVRRSAPAREAQRAYLDTFVEFWLQDGVRLRALRAGHGFHRVAPGAGRHCAGLHQAEGVGRPAPRRALQAGRISSATRGRRSRISIFPLRIHQLAPARTAWA